MSSGSQQAEPVALSADAYWGRVASVAAIAAAAVAVAYLIFRGLGFDLQPETKGNQWVNAGFCQLFTNPFSDVDYTSGLPSVTLTLAVSQAFGMSLLGGIFGYLLKLVARDPVRIYTRSAIAVYLGLGGLVAFQAGSWGTGVGLWVLHTLVLFPALRWVAPALGRASFR